IINGPHAMDSAHFQVLASVVDSTMFAVTVDQSRWNELMHCEASAVRCGLEIAGTILHSGTARGDRRLCVAKQQRVSRDADLAESLGDAIDESRVRSEIEAIQNEMRSVRTGRLGGCRQASAPEVRPTSTHRNARTAT
ncbi:MAG: hypothetical protein WBD31_29415, partial [Rubripirellula sp.]